MGLRFCDFFTSEIPGDALATPQRGMPWQLLYPRLLPNPATQPCHPTLPPNPSTQPCYPTLPPNPSTQAYYPTVLPNAPTQLSYPTLLPNPSTRPFLCNALTSGIPGVCPGGPKWGHRQSQAIRLSAKPIISPLAGKHHV